MLKILTRTIMLATLLIIPLDSHAQEKGKEVPPSESISVGTPAPAFNLLDLSKKTYDLKDFLGESAVVLSFWSIYCDSCVDEMMFLQKLEDKYRGKDLVILAINEDIRVPEERIRRFKSRLEKYRGNITYPILLDHDSAVFTSYKGTYLPTMVVIDKEGKISSYRRGYDPEIEPELIAEIKSIVGGEKPGETPGPELSATLRETITASGRSTLCGFFDETGWKKSFTGYESLDQEMEVTKEIARRDTSRNALVEALSILDVYLHSNEPDRKCIDEYGIHLGRDPFNTNDPVSKLLDILDYSEFFETLSEQEVLIGNDYHISRRVRISIDSLADELASLGYLTDPLRIEFTYVNMSPLDQKVFLKSLLEQSKFIGHFDNPAFTPHSTSQVFDVFTSSQGFADEILEMDFGEMQVFVEEVTPTSLELEVWIGSR